MPINVLLIGDFDFFGGTRTYFNQLIEYHESNNHTIYIALDQDTINKTASQYTKYPIIKLPRKNFGLIPWTLSEPINYLLYILNQVIFLIAFFIITRKYKITLTVVSLGDISRYLAIFCLKTPCLYIIHTIPGTKNFLDRIINLYLRIALTPKHRIITVSNHMRNVICKNWGNRVNTKYIQTIYNSTLPLQQYSNPNHKKKETDNCVLTLGHVVWYKNPDMWIRVAELLDKNELSDPITWLWAGDGEQIEYYKMITRDKTLHNVQFIGYYQHVHDLYNRATIYFQPSIIENFPLSVLDAMQLGIPCVVTNVGGLPELVIDGKTGFIIKEGDIKGAAEKILWLLLHPKEREIMGNCGKKRYLNHFTHMRWVSDMKKIHDEILP